MFRERLFRCQRRPASVTLRIRRRLFIYPLAAGGAVDACCADINEPPRIRRQCIEHVTDAAGVHVHDRSARGAVVTDREQNSVRDRKLHKRFRLRDIGNDCTDTILPEGLGPSAATSDYSDFVSRRAPTRGDAFAQVTATEDELGHFQSIDSSES
jgi:hypothetical protein